MKENEVRSLALFFFFAFLDDQKAIEAASRTLVYCQGRLKKNPEHNVAVLLVSATKLFWDKYKSSMTRGRTNTSLDSGWLYPEGLDIGPWREFQKTASDDELIATIWSKILKISDEDISEGLGISQGTIRFRLGRALRHLGGMTHQLGRARNV